jgi:hypothetical protein
MATFQRKRGPEQSVSEPRSEHRPSELDAEIAVPLNREGQSEREKEGQTRTG